MTAIATSTESMVVQHLLADPTLSAKVGDRIYLRRAQQGAALPFVVVLRVSATGHHVHAEPSDFEAPRVQVSIYARTAQECSEVAGACRRALDAYRGLMVGVQVHFGRLVAERDAMEGPSDGSDLGPFATHQDYVITHRRAG